MQFHPMFVNKFQKSYHGFFFCLCFREAKFRAPYLEVSFPMGTGFSLSDNRDLYSPRKVAVTKTKVKNEDDEEEEEIISYRIKKKRKKKKVSPMENVVLPFFDPFRNAGQGHQNIVTEGQGQPESKPGQLRTNNDSISPFLDLC